MTSKQIGDGSQPLIGIPLMGRTPNEVMDELQDVLAKNPDIIEWRADFFAAVAAASEVVELARKIKRSLGGLPLIFTIRSELEGGQPTSLRAHEIMNLNAAICRETPVEYVDCELNNTPESIHKLRQIAANHGTKLILSFHDFARTPSQRDMWQKFKTAEKYGADVAKIAVMPQKTEDVLALLSVTLKATRSLKIPVITMSMGGRGALTRMTGEIFGSAVTFAAGQSASAPGQVPVDDLRRVMAILKKSMEDH